MGPEARGQKEIKECFFLFWLLYFMKDNSL